MSKDEARDARSQRQSSGKAAAGLFSYVPGRPIQREELRSQLLPELRRMDAVDQRLLIIVPDNTRTLPMADLFKTFCETFAGRSAKLTFLIASGTHPKMTEDEMSVHLGDSWADIPGVEVLQHQWEDPDALVEIGSVPRSEVRRISRGLIDEDIPVRINRLVLECDQIVLVGPVFPHELIGFSGGYKYFFPGVSGPEMVHQTHWLGSLVVNPDLIGHKDTPVREMVDYAAGFVATPSQGLSLVMQGQDLMGLFFGPPLEAWAQAANISSQLNVLEIDRSYRTVIACVPLMYQDLWTGGKAMTKLQRVVADGGTLILYAPHIRRPVISHGDWHLKIGYHVPQYVLDKLDQYRNVPRAVLGDLIQLKGPGVVCDGVEISRFQVVLATGIPPEECRRLNLDYRDPASIRLEEYEGREAEGILVVREAGEILWTLKEPTGMACASYTQR